MKPCTGKQIFEQQIKAVLLILALAFPLSCLAMPESGETVTKRGTVDDDYYAAGGTVDINALVTGDVVVAGGDLFIGHTIEGDVIAAGGTISLQGKVMDDVRIAGGDITINSKIGDDLVASGGRIRIPADASVAGPGRLGGDERPARRARRNGAPAIAAYPA